MERRLQAMARHRRDQLCNAALSGAAPATDAWAAQMAHANQIVPEGQLVDARRFEPRLVEMMGSMDEFGARQRADFDLQAASAMHDARRGLEEDRKGITDTTASALAGTHDTPQQVAAMGGIAHRFAAGLRGVAHPASSQAGEFRTHAEEQLGPARQGGPRRDDEAA